MMRCAAIAGWSTSPRTTISGWSGASFARLAIDAFRIARERGLDRAIHVHLCKPQDPPPRGIAPGAAMSSSIENNSHAMLHEESPHDGHGVEEDVAFRVGVGGLRRDGSAQRIR